MSCSKEWEQRSRWLEQQTQVPRAGVDVVRRCRWQNCRRPLNKAGECPRGHPQGRAAALGMALGALGEWRGRGFRRSAVVAPLYAQAEREFPEDVAAAQVRAVLDWYDLQDGSAVAGTPLADTLRDFPREDVVGALSVRAEVPVEDAQFTPLELEAAVRCLSRERGQDPDTVVPPLSATAGEEEVYQNVARLLERVVEGHEEVPQEVREDARYKTAVRYAVMRGWGQVEALHQQLVAAEEAGQWSPAELAREFALPLWRQFWALRSQRALAGQLPRYDKAAIIKRAGAALCRVPPEKLPQVLSGLNIGPAGLTLLQQPSVREVLLQERAFGVDGLAQADEIAARVPEAIQGYRALVQLLRPRTIPYSRQTWPTRFQLGPGEMSPGEGLRALAQASRLLHTMEDGADFGAADVVGAAGEPFLSAAPEEGEDRLDGMSGEEARDETRIGAARGTSWDVWKGVQSDHQRYPTPLLRAVAQEAGCPVAPWGSRADLVSWLMAPSERMSSAQAVALVKRQKRWPRTIAVPQADGRTRKWREGDWVRLGDKVGQVGNLRLELVTTPEGYDRVQPMADVNFPGLPGLAPIALTTAERVPTPR